MGAQGRRPDPDQRLRGPVGAAARRAGRLVDPGCFPETARLFASALFETLPADTPDAAVADLDFTLGLDLILDGVAVRIGPS
ncbi:hypothetical protein [Nonomuraea sp. NPDC049725]|uniref:hypothetical protein n=1 Tax=Nonomuraea sp. NPDC049725 TaxID=3154508 RepID=UPI0034324B8F